MTAERKCCSTCGRFAWRLGMSPLAVTDSTPGREDDRKGQHRQAVRSRPRCTHGSLLWNPPAVDMGRLETLWTQNKILHGRLSRLKQTWGPTASKSGSGGGWGKLQGGGHSNRFFFYIKDSSRNCAFPVPLIPVRVRLRGITACTKASRVEINSKQIKLVQSTMMESNSY